MSRTSLEFWNSDIEERLNLIKASLNWQDRARHHLKLEAVGADVALIQPFHPPTFISISGILIWEEIVIGVGPSGQIFNLSAWI